MKILAEISERTLGLNDLGEQLGTVYELRKSARAILLDSTGKMATQHVRNYTFHKLPGGGVEPGEQLEEALLREIEEEVGCRAEVVKPVGVVIEYRNKYKLQIISYCFVAEVVGDVGEPALAPGEIEEGQVTLWLPPAEVLALMKQDQPGKFEGHFILPREIAFLEEYLRQNPA